MLMLRLQVLNCQSQSSFVMLHFYQSEELPLNQTKHNKGKIVLGRLLNISEGKYSDDHRVRACEKSTFVLEKNA